MNRLSLSPKASALARYLYERSTTFDFDDLHAADELALETDTIYKALQELAGLQALSFARRRQGKRPVTLHVNHWVWLAMKQTADDETASQ